MSPHFRAHERRAVRLPVGLLGRLGGERGAERIAVVVDVSIAGAGLETEVPLAPGEHLDVSFATPTLWDPLIVPAVVAWAAPPRPTATYDALGRPRVVARAGLRFDYPNPDAALAMFEMLATLDYE